MSPRTELNLALTFAAESRSSARNEAFAQKAEHDARPLEARLFRVLSESESVHARRALLLLRGKIGGTAENLQAALDRLNRAHDEEYPGMIRDAEEEGMNTVRTVFYQTREVEPVQAALLEKALAAGGEAADVDYYVCQICGYISESRAPDRCPVCGAIPGKFKHVV